MFDPKFYEYRALQHLAIAQGKSIKLNIRVPDLSRPLSKRNELDGLITSSREHLPIEVKSYPLTKSETRQIYDKYMALGYKELIIISPGFEVKKTKNNLQLVSFLPEPSSVTNFYRSAQPQYSAPLSQELGKGGHNFRYRMLHRSSARNARYINQVDKQIKTFDQLQRELLHRLPTTDPPIKVLWSVNRWLSPKGLFRKDAVNCRLGGPLVFDVDGPLVHRPFVDCELSPRTGLCDACIFFSKREANKLLRLLKEYGFEIVEVYFSGRSGFHIYIYDWQGHQKELIERIERARIKPDLSVTTNPLALIALPGSLHAASGYPVSLVKDLQSFATNSLKMVNYG